MWQTAPPFSELLAGCQRSAVHLEMRDHYDDPDEAPRVAAWKSGYRPDPDDRSTWWRPWLDMVAETVARGVEIRRARIVSEPVSEYTRYLYDGTFTNVAAGEQIRWLPRRKASDLALPGNDFWVFDDRLVRFGYFSGEGAYLGDDVTDEPAVAKLCVDAFEGVWDRATPHDEYRI
ncbi:DUF6879 family protein [Streptomyces purpurascens]|uniref:DUF6879 family protein n=1 Tax=Streptomyces purpurascens TaxID=1924 RepID=UPI001678AD97|nr:DUF6879 family protein [Streptomyces purpurascens]MCE7050650.1 hypothetical protein [Streptomyces purpurascens]GHA35450.1 hypothetical protein GCM10010303_52760 [Streptomyces purpurascens]